MKKNLAEAQQQYREVIVGTCLSCEKPQVGWWGRYGSEGVCSSKCATAHEAALTLKNADLRIFKGV